MSTGLVLRDIHVPPAPGWWPPAPGWWLLGLGVLALALAWGWWRVRARRRRRRLEALFDEAVAAASSPAGRVAAMSELLRRAARSRDATTATLIGDDWIRFLQAEGGADLTATSLDLLRDGGYRREVDAGEVDRLRDAARALFLSWSLRR